jgi:hypothetical protein
MSYRMRNLIVEISLAIALGVAAAMAMPRAYAEMIDSTRAQAQSERERIKAMLDRPELAAALEKMGLTPADARMRVDAMNDVEVAQLAGKLELLPAGGQLTTEQWLLVIIIVLLLVIAL